MLRRTVAVGATEKVPFIHRSKFNAKPRIMFTGIEADQKDIRLIEGLGGKYVTDISQCTHLITNKVWILSHIPRSAHGILCPVLAEHSCQCRREIPKNAAGNTNSLVKTIEQI